MKQFEKWLKENDCRNYLYSEEDAAKESWKAALKWVLTQQGQIDWRFNPVILPKYIEEELGE